MRVTRPVINNPARRVIAAFFARIQNNSTWRIVKFCFDFLYDLHFYLPLFVNSRGNFANPQKRRHEVVVRGLVKRDNSLNSLGPLGAFTAVKH